MPQLHSTDSFNMESCDRVDDSIVVEFDVLFRSINVNRYTFHYQRIETQLVSSKGHVKKEDYANSPLSLE